MEAAVQSTDFSAAGGEAEGAEASEEDPSHGIHNKEMVLLEDSTSIASKVKSSCMRLALHAADPIIAGCTAFFGLGTVVLPLVAAIDNTHDCQSQSDEIYAYKTFYNSNSEKRGHLYNERELKELFGLVDIQFKMKELALDAEALDAHIHSSTPQTLRREVRGIRRWREAANAALQLLQRRAALAFLGLTPDATEAEVSKVYKKLALELHPDKGGDPGKFQTLQEMRQRTIDPERTKNDQDGEEEDDDIELDPEDRHDIGVLRWEAHRSVVQLWQTVKTTIHEMPTATASETSSQEALRFLRRFILNFVQTDNNISDAKNNEHANLEDKFKEMAKTGAEIIAVAALLDPEAAHSILVSHLAAFSAAHGSPLGKRYAALLQATLKIKPQVSKLLTTFDNTVAQGKEGDDADANNTSCAETLEQVPVEEESPPANLQTENVEKNNPTEEVVVPAGKNDSMEISEEITKADLQVSSKSAEQKLQTRERADGEEMWTFTPPPFQLGSYQMQLRMVDRGSWEDVRVDMHNKDGRIGILHGTYVLRGVGTIHEACQAASAQLAACASSLFEDTGRPVTSWRNLATSKAWTGGVLFLEELIIEHPAVHSAGADMIRAVLKCLSGPMKRVTLAICADSSATMETQKGSETPALPRLCNKIGFQRAVNDRTYLFWEVGKRPNRPQKAERKVGTKRRQPLDTASTENIAPEQPSTKHSKVQQPPVLTANKQHEVIQACMVPSTDWEKLTPRNRHTIVSAATVGLQSLLADADRFTSGKPGGYYWGSESFPTQLQSSVFKAFVKGFADVVSVIGRLLQLQQVPNVDTVTRVISPFAGSPGEELGLHLNKHFVSHFIGVGGTVESALMAVIKEASSIYNRVDGDNSPLPGEEGDCRVYYALPMHMLDGDFEYVRSTLIPQNSL